MGSHAVTTGRWRRWLHPLQSVRVRITLAAVVVTALAVGSAGLLLVRSVEDAQIQHLRGDINDDLDDVVARLEDGAAPEEAMEVVAGTSEFGLYEVSGKNGNVLISFASGPFGVEAIDAREGRSSPAGGPAGDGTADGRTEAATGTSATDGGPAAAGPAPEDEGSVTFRESESAPVQGSATGITGGDPPPGGAPGLGDGPVGAVMTRSGVLARLETITRKVTTPDGELTVTAAMPVDQMARSVDALRQALAVGLPAVIVVVGALVWVLVGRALRPVEAIRAEADAITGSTIHRRVPEPATRDEIGRLARTMNAMLGRLDAAAGRQRQFVSDASHELRSPVAAIRTGLEVARRSPERADWPAVADAALAEESRLEALLDDLLLLAAQDETGAPAPTTPVSLPALAHAEAKRPRRVPVAVAADPTPAGRPVVPGDADQLARALSNLVDNAARYAASAVRIAVTRGEGSVRLVVDDDGPGIPPADRERVFERFARLDDSRARNDGGTGLGLAVVRSIVTRHHGLVWVEDSPEGGARIVVEIHARPPAAGAAAPGRVHRRHPPVPDRTEPVET
ncbi:MAG TPA: HAMP domain-containing sensor histidine kinase [Acidimicrobiales bacterium]|nr:HAMP domain-containing sensor histidine kinase [Acidimicrobiales bacterium]